MLAYARLRLLLPRLHHLLGAQRLGGVGAPRDLEHGLGRARHLRLEAVEARVVHDHLLWVRRPRLPQLPVLVDGLRGRLTAVDGVARVVRHHAVLVVLRGAVGCRDEVHDSVVPLQHVLLVDRPGGAAARELPVQPVEASLPHLVRHEGAPVHEAAVEDDDRRPPAAAREVGEASLELKLQLQHVCLEGEDLLGEAARRGRRQRVARVEEEGRNLGRRDHVEPGLRGGLYHVLQRRAFAGARPSGERDADDLGLCRRLCEVVLFRAAPRVPILVQHHLAHLERPPSLHQLDVQGAQNRILSVAHHAALAGARGRQAPEPAELRLVDALGPQCHPSAALPFPAAGGIRPSFQAAQELGDEDCHHGTGCRGQDDC
mmetsp:Transcript_21361/g.70605  ORF Transcript_21361/g.70605 Transcript_21361/m.70605 type:complete len:373 (+) Transcript_21361:111-1229(+)